MSKFSDYLNYKNSKLNYYISKSNSHFKDEFKNALMRGGYTYQNKDLENISKEMKGEYNPGWLWLLGNKEYEKPKQELQGAIEALLIALDDTRQTLILEFKSQIEIIQKKIDEEEKTIEKFNKDNKDPKIKAELAASESRRKEYLDLLKRVTEFVRTLEKTEKHNIQNIKGGRKNINYSNKYNKKIININSFIYECKRSINKPEKFSKINELLGGGKDDPNNIIPAAELEKQLEEVISRFFKRDIDSMLAKLQEANQLLAYLKDPHTREIILEKKGEANLSPEDKQKIDKEISDMAHVINQLIVKLNSMTGKIQSYTETDDFKKLNAAYEKTRQLAEKEYNFNSANKTTIDSTPTPVPTTSVKTYADAVRQKPTPPPSPPKINPNSTPHVQAAETVSKSADLKNHVQSNLHQIKPNDQSSVRSAVDQAHDKALAAQQKAKETINHPDDHPEKRNAAEQVTKATHEVQAAHALVDIKQKEAHLGSLPGASPEAKGSLQRKGDQALGNVGAVASAKTTEESKKVASDSVKLAEESKILTDAQHEVARINQHINNLEKTYNDPRTVKGQKEVLGKDIVTAKSDLKKANELLDNILKADKARDLPTMKRLEPEIVRLEQAVDSLEKKDSITSPPKPQPQNPQPPPPPPPPPSRPVASPPPKRDSPKIPAMKIGGKRRKTSKKSSRKTSKKASRKTSRKSRK